MFEVMRRRCLRSVLFWACCLWLAVHTAVAAAITGEGSLDCAAWIDSRESGDGWQQGLQWTLGYLAGVSEGSRSGVRESDPEAVVAAMENYCRLNTQQSLLQAARSLRAAPGIVVAGPGNAAGELSDQSTMNEICRNTYPGNTGGVYPVRWATTTDYREFSTAHGWNYNMEEIDEFVALRAENTIITADGRLLDQATGAVTTAATNTRYPGAVILEPKVARFGARSRTVTPLCVWGPPNPALRCH